MYPQAFRAIPLKKAAKFLHLSLPPHCQGDSLHAYSCAASSQSLDILRPQFDVPTITPTDALRIPFLLLTPRRMRRSRAHIPSGYRLTTIALTWPVASGRGLSGIPTFSATFWLPNLTRFPGLT